MVVFMFVYLVRYSPTQDSWDWSMVVGVYRKEVDAQNHAHGSDFHRVYRVTMNTVHLEEKLITSRI